MNRTIIEYTTLIRKQVTIEEEIIGRHMRQFAAHFREGELSELLLIPRVVYAACNGKTCVHLGYAVNSGIRYEVALASECVDRAGVDFEPGESACGRALNQLAALLEDPPRANYYYVRFDAMTRGADVAISEVLDAPTCGQYSNAESTNGNPVDPTNGATPGMTYRVNLDDTKMPRAVAIPRTAPSLSCGNKAVFDTVKHALHRYRSVPFTDGYRVDPITPTHSAAESALEHYVVVGTATVLEGDLPYEPSISATSRGAIFQYGNNLYILERRAEASTHS